MQIQALVDATQEHWYNQTLVEVGGIDVRLGVMQGEFHWHKHDEQDEFFFVLDGEFQIEDLTPGCRRWNSAVTRSGSPRGMVLNWLSRRSAEQAPLPFHVERILRG